MERQEMEGGGIGCVWSSWVDGVGVMMVRHCEVGEGDVVKLVRRRQCKVSEG